MSHLVQKYLYGNELKSMYQTFKSISEEFSNHTKIYDHLKINNLMEQSIVELNQLRDHSLQKK